MSITSRITSMGEHVANAYNGLAGLGADLTGIDKNIENISMVLDDIYDSMPQVSGEGTNLTLDDTRVGKIKTTLKGNTSQTGTPTPTSPIPVNVVSGDNEIVVNGKNFLNNINFVKGRLDNGVLGYASNTTALTTTQDSVEFTTNANYRGVTSDYIVVQSSTDYVYQQKSSLSGLYLSLACYDSNKTYLGDPTITNVGTSSRKITMLANTKFFRINIQLNTAGTIKLEELMLFKGSSATTYEPYQGNTYNIDLPVENLLPISSLASTTSNGITFTNNNDGTYTLNGTATAEATFYLFNGETSITANDKITFSCLDLTGRVRLFWYDNWSAISGSNARIGDGNSNYTTTNSIEKITKLYMNISIPNGVTVSNLTIKPMIQKGTKANSYTPYGTAPIELCKIGTYQDYFYKDSDKWYWHREIGKVVLDGTQTINNLDISSTNTVRMVYYNGVPNGASPVAIMSNRLVLNTNVWNADQNGVSYNATNYSLFLRLDKSLVGTTEASINTYLSSNNIDLYYPLSTPTNTEITYQPLIDQLNLLEKAMSKDGQTNISQVNNDKPFVISASALKEWSE